MNRAEALEKLQEFLERMKAGDDDQLAALVEARDQVLSRYQPIFSDEHLPRLTRDEFLSFLSIKNNHHWTGIQRSGGVVTKDMDALREALSLLLDESRPLSERLDQLRPPSGGGLVERLGPATLTPILMVRYPEKYAVFNKTLETALRALNLWPDIPRAAPFSVRYTKVNELALGLAKELGIDLWTLDALWWRARRLGEAASGQRDWLRRRIDETWDREEFTLTEVYEFEDEFRRLYPDNKNVRAKLRQLLQQLRNERIIRFVRPGTYQRVQPAPELDPRELDVLRERFLERLPGFETFDPPRGTYRHGSVPTRMN